MFSWMDFIFGSLVPVGAVQSLIFMLSKVFVFGDATYAKALYSKGCHVREKALYNKGCHVFEKTCKQGPTHLKASRDQG